VTANVIDAVLAELRAFDEWPDGQAPDAFHFGEIPPLASKCEVGVMAGPQQPLEMPAVSDTEEELVIQLSMAIDSANMEASLRRALALRDTLRKIIWHATNWGLEDVTQTNLLGSTIGIGVDTRTNGWVLAADVSFSVTYRDDF